MFRKPVVRVVVMIGFAFMVCFYGLPFVMSLYLQQIRGLSTLATGVVFLPMMVIGAALTPFSARLVERLGTRTVIGTGLVLMAAGLVLLAALATSAPAWLLASLMMLVGIGGPTVMPPAIAALLSATPTSQAGTASGVLNTSRQLGGALAVAVFGGLLAGPGSFEAGMRTSLLLAAVIGAAAAILAFVVLRRDEEREKPTPREELT